MRKAVLKLTECQKPFHISMNGPAVTVYTELNPALEKECLSKKGTCISLWKSKTNISVWMHEFNVCNNYVCGKKCVELKTINN